MRKLKQKKLNSRKMLGLATVILAGGILTSCSSLIYTKEYEYTRIERSSDGVYSEVSQYSPFNSDNNKNLSNSFISYSEWIETKDNNYSRIVKEYDVNRKDYNDIKELFESNKEIEEVLGKPSKTYEQMSKTLSKDEIDRGAYFEATIYSENKKKYVLIKDSKSNIGVLVFGLAGFTLATGTLIAWKKYDENSSEKKDKNKKLTLKK